MLSITLLYYFLLVTYSTTAHCDSEIKMEEGAPSHHESLRFEYIDNVVIVYVHFDCLLLSYRSLLQYTIFDIINYLVRITDNL